MQELQELLVTLNFGLKSFIWLSIITTMLAIPAVLYIFIKTIKIFKEFKEKEFNQFEKNAYDSFFGKDKDGKN